ncbi:MAG: hypothetical protein KKG92_06645, partial [Gammaproteobacteria bacterium]|nr:hypothetical protein [Gammaproteobacteria bacterium]
LNQLLPVELDTLAAIAQSVRHRRRAVPAAMEQVLLALCKDRYLGLRVIAELLERRDSKHLRDKVLNPMVKQGLLYRAYPRPNDPRQAYTSSAVAVPVASE